MQRLEERDQRRHLRGAQVLAVGGHVAAALQHLADQLIARQPRRDVVERRAAQAALAAERVAVAALLALQDERALQLERRATLRGTATGVGSALHASITGDHGANVPS